VVYDHFLARDEKEFSPEGLENFAEGIYKVLHDYTFLLPEKFNSILPFMHSGNWLVNYRFAQGIEKSFGGILRRAAYLENNINVFHLFRENYDHLYSCYQQFFPAIKEFAFAECTALIEA
jgi:acyl carrier protein phosphodiesterase